MNNIEKLKNELIEQRNTKFPGNIYHVTHIIQTKLRAVD